MRRPNVEGKAARVVTSPKVVQNDGFGLAPRVRVAFAGSVALSGAPGAGRSGTPPQHPIQEH
jgi:hypothetical protein